MVVLIPTQSVPPPAEAHDIADAVIPSLALLDPDALAEQHPPAR